MLQNHCEFTADYPALLRDLNDPLKLQSAERIIQFPFAVPVVEEKTEEELNKVAERRKEQGRKLQEMAAKARMDKVTFFLRSCGAMLNVTQLNKKEEDLQYLLNLREGRATDSKREWTVSSLSFPAVISSISTACHHIRFGRRLAGSSRVQQQGKHDSPVT